MAKYQVTTDNGTYEVETDEPSQPTPNVPSATDRLNSVAKSLMDTYTNLSAGNNIYGQRIYPYPINARPLDIPGYPVPEGALAVARNLGQGLGGFARGAPAAADVVGLASPRAASGLRLAGRLGGRLSNLFKPAAEEGRTLTPQEMPNLTYTAPPPRGPLSTPSGPPPPISGALPRAAEPPIPPRTDLTITAPVPKGPLIVPPAGPQPPVSGIFPTVPEQPVVPRTPIWSNLPSPTGAGSTSEAVPLPRVSLLSGRTVGGPAIDVRTGQPLTNIGGGEFSNVSPVNTRAIPTKVTVIPRAVEPEPGPYPEGVGIHGGVENTPIPVKGQPEVVPERYDEGSAAPKIKGSEAKSTIVARQLLDHLQEKGFTWDDVQALNPEGWRAAGNEAGVGKPNKLVIQKVMNRMNPEFVSKQAPSETGITLSPELQQRLQSSGAYQKAVELKRALGQ